MRVARSKCLKSYACLGQVQKCKLKYKAYLEEEEIKIERDQEDIVKGLVTFQHRLSMVCNREEVKSILGRGII